MMHWFSVANGAKDPACLGLCFYVHLLRYNDGGTFPMRRSALRTLVTNWQFRCYNSRPPRMYPRFLTH